jgi:hypothetical protein
MYKLTRTSTIKQKNTLKSKIKMVHIHLILALPWNAIINAKGNWTKVKTR